MQIYRFLFDAGEISLGVERWTTTDLEAGLVSRSVTERDGIGGNSEVLPKRPADLLHPPLHLRPLCAGFRTVPNDAILFCHRAQHHPYKVWFGLAPPNPEISEPKLGVVASFSVRAIADLNPFIVQKCDFDGIPINPPVLVAAIYRR